MSEKKNNESLWLNLCHLTAFSIFIGIPFGNILGPLIIWQIKKDEFASVDREGKKSLNFQLSMTLYFFISAILVIGLIGVILIPLVLILDVIWVVVAIIKLNNNEDYTYPLTIKFIN